MNLTDQQIKEIAEELDFGLRCFVHKKTGEIESYPHEEDLDDIEPWQETIDKVENDFESYVELSPMNSNESYEVMENFALTVEDQELRTRLLKILDRPKPFANFKIEVDESEYREDWFKFKDDAYIDWVKEQIEENRD